MNARNIILALAVTAGAIYWIKKSSNKSKNTTGPASAAPEEDNSQVVQVVEETLHQHAGEDNPIVHAFETALEHETKSSNGLVSA